MSATPPPSAHNTPSPRPDQNPTELTKFGIPELNTGVIKPQSVRIQNITEAAFYYSVTPGSLNGLNVTKENGSSLGDV